MEVQTAKDLQNDINNNIDILIQKIQPLTKQNQANVNITQLLIEFYKTVQKSESYHKLGIFALNFAKAASFLDHAFQIYAKQVDLLWDLSINAQKRYLSYEEDSAEKVEAEKRLEEKAQFGKRRRKTAVVEIPPEEVPVDWKKVRLKMKKYFRKSLLDLDEFNFDDELDGAEVNPDTLEPFQRLKWFKSWNKLYPKKYVMAPYIDSGFVTQIDEDCYYHSDNATNYLDFLFPEIQRKLAYNFTENKNLDTIGCDVYDKAFQHFICNEQISNPVEHFNAEINQKFNKFLERYLIDGQPPMSLSEKCKKLCPRRTSIVLTRLSSDVVQNHLINDEPSTSKDDSGFFEDFEDTDQDSSTFINPSNETEIIIRRSERKRKPINIEPPIKLKRQRKKDIFKWLKTTTVSLKRFEKFFLSNYITESDEGEIKEIDFSSDDEDFEDNHEEDFENNHEEDHENTENTTFLNATTPNTEIECPNSDNLEKLEQQATLKRYLDWNQFIKDELKRRNQIEFDIHEYGTKIINKLSEEKTVGFNNILINSNVNSGGGEIARYFAAALQLVNSKNVQFTNFESGQVANNFELILINRDRHHEHLDQYKNASDVIIQEKLNKMGEKRRYSDDERKTYKKIKKLN
nr:uncharacterized protein LOC111416056 [Onthophagus taurus]